MDFTTLLINDFFFNYYHNVSIIESSSLTDIKYVHNEYNKNNFTDQLKKKQF